MAKTQTKQKKKKQESRGNPNSTWLQMRTGLIIITVVSIGVGIFMGRAVYQIDHNIQEGILWGLGFGGAIWAIFIIALLFNRFVRGNR